MVDLLLFAGLLIVFIEFPPQANGFAFEQADAVPTVTWLMVRNNTKRYNQLHLAKAILLISTKHTLLNVPGGNFRRPQPLVIFRLW